MSRGPSDLLASVPSTIMVAHASGVASGSPIKTFLSNPASQWCWRRGAAGGAQWSSDLSSALSALCSSAFMVARTLSNSGTLLAHPDLFDLHGLPDHQQSSSGAPRVGECKATFETTHDRPLSPLAQRADALVLPGAALPDSLDQCDHTDQAHSAGDTSLAGKHNVLGLGDADYAVLCSQTMLADYARALAAQQSCVLPWDSITTDGRSGTDVSTELQVARLPGLRVNTALPHIGAAASPPPIDAATSPPFDTAPPLAEAALSQAVDATLSTLVDAVPPSLTDAMSSPLVDVCAPPSIDAALPPLAAAALLSPIGTALSQFVDAAFSPPFHAVLTPPPTLPDTTLPSGRPPGGDVLEGSYVIALNSSLDRTAVRRLTYSAPRRLARSLARWLAANCLRNDGMAARSLDSISALLLHKAAACLLNSVACQSLNGYCGGLHSSVSFGSLFRFA